MRLAPCLPDCKLSSHSSASFTLPASVPTPEGEAASTWAPDLLREQLYGMSMGKEAWG